jgi:hypothetical protein
MLLRVFVVLTTLLSMSGGASAQEQKPKFGPDALPLSAATDFVRHSPAPDFWQLIAFNLPQDTSSACSVASVAMAVNALRGVPPGAEDELVTQARLLEAVGDPNWVARTVEDGDGVTFADLAIEASAGLAAFELEGATVEAFKPHDAGAATLSQVRALLEENEGSADDVLLVYFNQGVLTGDWDGPHISPIGAYDAAADRVLLLDVDRAWYVPYWSPVPKLLEAMLKPAGREHGPLAGETGGLVHISRQP